MFISSLIFDYAYLYRNLDSSLWESNANSYPSREPKDFEESYPLSLTGNSKEQHTAAASWWASPMQKIVLKKPIDKTATYRLSTRAEREVLHFTF